MLCWYLGSERTGKQEQLLPLLSSWSGPSCPHSIYLSFCDFVSVYRMSSALPCVCLTSWLMHASVHSLTKVLHFLGQCCVLRMKVMQHNLRHRGNIINDKSTFILFRNNEDMMHTRFYLSRNTKFNSHQVWEVFPPPPNSILVYVCRSIGHELAPVVWLMCYSGQGCCALYSVFRHSGDSSVSCQYSDLGDGIVQMLLSQTRRFPARGNLLL